MIAFRAHKGGADQSGWPVNTYSLVTWPALDYDRGGRFANGLWLPVDEGEAERPVVFSGQLWLRQNCLGTPPNYVARIAKNQDWPGQTIDAQIGVNSANFPGSFVITISMQDIARPGDRYGVYLYATHSGAILDGHPWHTFWAGAAL